MGIFDKLKSTAQQAVNSAVQSVGNKRETFSFGSLPESLSEMQALPEASPDTPFKAAALTVLALCAYAADKKGKIKKSKIKNLFVKVIQVGYIRYLLRKK